MWQARVVEFSEFHSMFTRCEGCVMSGVSGVSSVFKKVQWVLSLFVVKIQKKEKEGGESSTQINKSNTTANHEVSLKSFKLFTFV